jgi:hypothetical protein
MNPTVSQFSRQDSLASEGLEKNQNLAQNQQALEQEREQDKQAMNNVWNSFLSAEPSQPISITRLDTPESKTSETKAVSFEEIYAQINNKSQDSGQSRNDSIDSVGTSEAKEYQPDYIPALLVEEKVVTKLEGTFMFQHGEAQAQKDEHIESEKSSDNTLSTEAKSSSKVEVKNVAVNTSKEVLNQSLKVGKIGFKEGKDVFNAVSDLWNSFIGFREKKVDPKAKENAEKAAKRKANKLQFIGLLKEGISLYYAAMQKALIELEVKLGVNALGTEDRNKILGRNRNLSFTGNNSVYAIHQTAFEMVEQKKRQAQRQSAPSSGRGKPSAGQIFRDKNLQGERSGGNNMMSAVG